MKKIILILTVFVTMLFSNEAELLFWDEVKDRGDVELLKLYKKQYPKGIFESLADIKIKRLMQANIPQEEKNKIPNWLKGDHPDYQYYGVGKANEHFKGKDYQENLARSRAKRELQQKFDNSDLTQEKIYEYQKLERMEKHIDDRGRIYILLYVDNYDL